MRCVRECRTRDKVQRRIGILLGGPDDTAYKASGGSADGYHRVPNVNANSDDDFKFNLGNFEKVWNDDNTLLCFCDGIRFLPLLSGGSFVFNAFLPSAKHAPHLIEQ